MGVKDCLCSVNRHFRRHYIIKDSLSGCTTEHQHEVLIHLIVESARQVYGTLDLTDKELEVLAQTVVKELDKLLAARAFPEAS